MMLDTYYVQVKENTWEQHRVEPSVVPAFGPAPFRLNKGTALKFIKVLEETDWTFDPCQLSFEVDGVTYGSPEGLLARIVEPSPKLAWDGLSHMYDGEQFYLTDNLKKRLKFRGSIPETYNFNDVKRLVEYMLDHTEWERKETEN